MQTFGKHLTWFLGEVSQADSEQLEDGAIEIFGEDEQGREGSCVIEIPNLAHAAKDRIESLEHALAQVLELASRDSEHFGNARPDIAELAKETLNTISADSK